MEEIGKVWIAGAGPGDMQLLTLKTRELMTHAQVVVYDALVSVEILSLIPEETLKINVGKRSGHHPVPQEEINQILLQQAKKGKQVLRLKGGDPFIFGRGGEELELLLQEQIPFEIVPGVPSVSAVPAYAGIPITHRDYTSSFHVITGHPKKDGSLHLDYESLVKFNGTLIFLMGISSMDCICKGLMEAGMDGDMPAAVLEKGTTARQRKVISSVSQLVCDSKKAQIQTPAMIVVGKVCSLSKQFAWAEDRPLGGRQILLTRPKERSAELANKLRKLGAQVIELPSIATKLTVSGETLQNALERISSKQEEWLVFTSPTGVELFFEQLEIMQYDIRRIFRKQPEMKIAVIGSATKKALKSRGLWADLMPKIYCGSELGALLAKTAKPKSKITILRAETGSPLLVEKLEEKNLQVFDIALYQTICHADETLKEKITELFCNQEIDGATFTSASTVRGFAATFEQLDYTMVKAICIGEQTKAEADRYGMQTVVSKEATMDSMIECMRTLWQR
ncbi:MAG: uroporphyrinogen-III C-methyltransferase [Lachnospiraceae bacterium]